MYIFAHYTCVLVASSQLKSLFHVLNLDGELILVYGQSTARICRAGQLCVKGDMAKHKERTRKNGKDNAGNEQTERTVTRYIPDTRLRVL